MYFCRCGFTFGGARLYVYRHGVTPGGLFLPLRAWFELCGCGYIFVGVVLPLKAWFSLCRRAFTCVGVVFPLYAIFLSL